MAADPITKSTVDDLFNGDFSDLDDDPFADNPILNETRDDKAVLSPRSGLKRKIDEADKENDGLGIEEEVKIVKKRKPIAKLDEERLLSEPGLPKLRSLVRSKELAKKLRFKGKGHEFTDAARLLNHFQLWLDNLYPRAKFADGLQLIEKAGHTKRMQITRLEWINEGRPGYRRYEDVQTEGQSQNDPDLFGSLPAQTDENLAQSTGANAPGQQTGSLSDDEVDRDAMFIPDANQSPRLHAADEPDDDELDALLAAQDDSSKRHTATTAPQRTEDSEGEDDLDALLAEQEAQSRQRIRTPPPRPGSGLVQSEDDELDAILAEHEAERTRSTSRPAISTVKSSEAGRKALSQDSDNEEDDLEALLALQRTRIQSSSKASEPSLPTPQHTSSPVRQPRTSSPPTAVALGSDSDPTVSALVPTFSSSPVPNNPEEVDLDALDALLASQEAKEDAARAQAQTRTQMESTTVTPRANKVRNAMDDLLSSSPVPNDDSQ